MGDGMLKASRIVGLDLSYLFTNGFWVILRYGITAFLGLLLTIGFARLGSKELFGQYQFILSLIALLSVFSLPGFNIAALKSVALGKGGNAVRQAVRWSFLSSLLALPIIGCYAAFRYFVRDDLSFEMTVALLVGAVLFPFFYAPNTWYAAYEGKSLFKPVAIRTILASFTVTMILLAGILFHIGLVALLTVYFGLNALFSWYFYAEVIRRERAERRKGSVDGDALDIRYGFAITVQKFAYGLSDNIPPLVLSYFLGFEFLAVFQIAYYFMNAVSGVLAALSALYMPKLLNGMKLIHKRILFQNIVAGIVSYLFLALLLKIIFIFFYGENYRESYGLAWLLAPLLILYPSRIYLINYFTAQGRNALIISACMIANIIGPIAFLLMKNADPFIASVSYIYALTLSTLLILLPAYFSVALRKADPA